MWQPQPGPQSSAITARWADELFYGGARGGGKSDFQLGYQLDGALTYPRHWRGIMFRKTYPELEELQARAMEVFGVSGAVYKTQPSDKYPFSNCWYWPGGASVKMRYIEHERDYTRYHGHQYTGISFDEVTEYASPDGLLKMLSTLRSAHGVPCTVRLTGNPGGPGHIWVKARYIDESPPLVPYTDPDTGFTRLFVPARLGDNQALLKADPNYINRIRAATEGNEALRRAWEDGAWDIVAGAFFDCWERNKHVIKPFTIPDNWVRFRSMDWGSARPFSVGWWAVSSGDILPRGAMVRFREWYGAKSPNVGLKMRVEDVAEGILARTKGRIDYGVADPAIWHQDGGESIGEKFMRQGVIWRRGDNKRIPGWQQVRDRLIGEDDKPMIYTFDTCTDSIRTIPMLQHDSAKIEDIDTDMEDHAADDWRYACMSRPYARPIPTEEKIRWPTGQTINEIIEANRRRRADG